MSPHFTFGSFIIPYIVFIFSLYLAVVPKELSHRTQKSNKRIILCCLGAFFGLFTSISILIDTRNDMTIEGDLFLRGLALFSWCIYSLFTNHSNLSRGKKIAKVIIYWLITSCFLNASAYHETIRFISQSINFILAVIAYYTVCDRKIEEGSSKKDNPNITKSKKQNKVFHNLFKNISHITKPFNHIKQYCANNFKFIIITIIIIILLLLLPFYVEYFIDNSGLKSL